MKSKYPFYNSPYFKGLPINRRLMIRFRRTWFKIYCILDAFILGKFKYGWRYNGQDSPENE